MKAILLARVSDKKQDSNKAQFSRILNYLPTKNLQEWKVIDIEESSTKGDRKKFKKIFDLIDEAKEEVAVVAETVDRFQRRYDESVQFRELIMAGKVQLHFIRDNLVIHKNSNSSEIMRWDMSIMFAKSYVLQLSDNVKRKNEQLRREGRWVGQAKTGYLNTRDNQNKPTITIDPIRGPMVVQIFELYATNNYSVEGLVRYLNEKGYSGKWGAKIVKSMVFKILNDTFYFGLAKSDKYGTYFHIHPTLINKDLFDRCQAILNGRYKNKPLNLEKPYVFNQLVKCGNCGCSMTPEFKKNKYVLYSCTNYKKLCVKGDTYVSQDELLKPILGILEQFKSIPDNIQELIDEEVKVSNKREKEYRDQHLKLIQSKMLLNKQKLDRLFDLRLEDSSITKEEYDEKAQKLKDEQMSLQLQLEEHTKADFEFKKTLITMLNLCKNAKDLFLSSEHYDKRKIVNFLISNATYKAEKLDFTLKTPFNLILNLTQNAYHPNLLLD